jgi:hypothetical protein
MTNYLVLIRQLNYNDAIGNELVFSEFDVKIMNKELTFKRDRSQRI